MFTRKSIMASLFLSLVLFASPAFAEKEGCKCSADKKCECGESCKCDKCHCDSEGACGCEANSCDCSSHK